ncbi:threonine--tRNA ligase [Candidatus Dependentiae bacterium]|nr:threonine--tRNA ligase [Candidatus Dependentiae bacterium]
MKLKILSYHEIEVDSGKRFIDLLSILDIKGVEEIVGLKFNSEIVYWYDEIPSDGEIQLLKYTDEEGLEILRHSTSHIMAQAIGRVFPGVKFAIGPAIAEGFYYDLDLKKKISENDFEKIEEEMQKIIDQDYKFIREFWSRDKATKFFNEKKENFKVELIEGIPDKEVSIFSDDDFLDLCRGPHIPSTGKVKAFKLLSIAGAYWRGDERNPMLTRIYGTAFPTQAELDLYIERLKEAEKRDHRKLGKELELFHIYETAGSGLVFWLPNGALIRTIIEDFWRKEHLKHGYELVFTPHIAKKQLWETSGHLDFYAENMYEPIKVDDQEFILKPMNCPFHILMYKSKKRSYRELPIRWAELGTVYRYERSGVLHGLLRVRGFTQDDAHIICEEKYLEKEVMNLLSFTLFFLKTFGFKDYFVYLATRPPKFVGDPGKWDRAQEALKKAIEKFGLDYKIDEGGGAFYGPKIDMKIRDELGREWQCTTLQFDFNLPQRFNMTYISDDGTPKEPIMIHRALLGAIERFFGLLIEHYAGKFPGWLAPVQISIIPITDHQLEYCQELKKELELRNFRVFLDSRGERMGYKIRDAQSKKIPIMIIIGKREAADNIISVRHRDKGDQGTMTLVDFLEKFEKDFERPEVELKLEE